MKRLNDLTKYVLSVKYIEGEACPDMEETNDECDNDFAYLEYSDVEELVSELDDVFENCKMDLESEKATVEELKNSHGWHKVSEELPTHNRAVAISPEFKGCGFACYNEYDNCWDTEDGDDRLCDIDDVNYWFEIPEAPKE